MGRGRVQLKRIESKINRQVTFSKRRAGLIKKAHEISVLCEADVAVIVFSAKGRLFEYSTNERMEGILDRYEIHSNAELQVQGSGIDARLTLECAKLKNRLGVLERNKRQLMGEDLDTATLRELQHLEQQLVSTLKHIRKKKNQLMNESISELRKREKALQEQNNMLDKKVKEEMAMIGQLLTRQQQDNGRTNTTSPASSSTVLQHAVPSTYLRSSRGRDESGDIPAAEALQPADPVLPPWMLRPLN
ncbi:hypothetical protein MLD38_039348 [Melastoma candidum]|uniref:Uncharacterized protein n=1 Tax=Melastoma candidum TaxID=119954 RepID=A0ACB9L283_9MYRT|nr:hypothetical protein MLD38_039348 [Melastoma candidum]